MYGKPPPLPPPIPNESPSSFHPAPPPPPPCQPPPPPPHNEPIPSYSLYATQARPPLPSGVNSSVFSGFISYQQPLQYPIPYNAQQLQYGGDNSRTFIQPRPPQPSCVPPRPSYNPAIRPLMPPQFDHPLPGVNQSGQLRPQLNHGNWPPSQFDHSNQPSSQNFDHSNQPSPLFNHGSQPLPLFDQKQSSQFDRGSQPPLQIGQNQPPSQFNHGSQPPSQFDRGSQPPSQFDRGSQPPSQFDHSSQSPSQFGHGSQPPSQFGHGNQPPSQLNQNQPPSQLNHKNQHPSQFDYTNQPSTQFDQSQPPSQFDHNKPQPLFGHNNRLPSQFDHSKQPPQFNRTSQLDSQRQYDDSQQPSQLHNIETRRLPYYQLPSGSDSAGPKPLMDLPQVPLNKEDLMEESYGTRSSDQRPVADAAVNNGNTNFHPVPCHIAAQHKPSHRRTLLPGDPYQWTPHHSERTHYGGDGGYHQDRDGGYHQDRDGGYHQDRDEGYHQDRDEGYHQDRDEGYHPDHDPEPSEYPDNDHQQPYHMLKTHEKEREVEKPPPQTITAEKLFGATDQRNRPTHFVIILRGLPGSGKTCAAKLIKEKELANGFSAPRILSLDDYFLVEVEKKVTDPTSGKKIKKKVTEYEYDAAMEEHYRASLFKSFNKTLDDGYFPVVVIDAINHKVSHFYQCWSAAKMKGFEVYVCEMNNDIDECVSQNVHDRTVEEITQLKHEWEETPSHIIRLDADSLLHETNESTIDEVEMAGVSTESTDGSPSTGSRVDQWIKQQEDQASHTVKSKWENLSLTGEDKLDQLDGFSRKRKRSLSVDDSSEISLTDYLNRQEKKLNKPGKKRVRWADLEAEKEKERKKEIGFHIGGEWTKISEEEAEGLLHGNSAIK